MGLTHGLKPLATHDRPATWLSKPENHSSGAMTAIEGVHELFGFLTTEANASVAPIHPKAMPVILNAGGNRPLT